MSSALIQPSFSDAFATAAIATTKVFAVGAVGFYAVWRKWVSGEALSGMSALVAYITLPCLIFQRFATTFDPQTFPGWWKVALMGMVLQFFAIGLGSLVAKRHKNQESTLLIGYQNAGFFVLPMLQALLPPSAFDRAALMLFMFIIFFNASLWPVGNWILLHKKEVNARAIVFSPATFMTLLALLIFGVFHAFAHRFGESLPWEIVLGHSSAGALQLVGDLTVPLATLVLGGAIARTVETAGGVTNVEGKRDAAEIALWKLFVLPLLGYIMLRIFPVPDQGLRLLLMLEFAAPPAINVAVFCQQHNYPMRLIPTASLLCYALSIISVPLWVAMVL